MNATPATPARPRVLDYASGQGFIPAIGQTIDTRVAPWAAIAEAGHVTPGLYRVTGHTISTEPNRHGKISRNAGKQTVKLSPALTVAEAREALALAEARVTEAREALAEAEARAVATPAPAPAAPAPADAMAALASMEPAALLAMLASLTGQATPGQ